MVGAISKKWQSIRNHPYIGAAFYGENICPISTDKFLDIVKSYDDALSINWKLNSLYIHPKEHDNRSTRSESIYRMKRGKSWDKTFEQYSGQECSAISVSCVPSSSMRALEYSSISISAAHSKVRPICYADFYGVWDLKDRLFVKDYREVFMSMFRKIKQVMRIQYGFMQLYTENCATSIIPHRKGYPLASKVELVPLIDEIAKSRYDGKLSRFPPSKWKGEPFNLYWANLINRKSMNEISLDQMLTETERLERVIISENVPEIACVAPLMDDYMYFCLSDNINDCLNPDHKYKGRYSKILKYMLHHKFIYPGIG